MNDQQIIKLKCFDCDNIMHIDTNLFLTAKSVECDACKKELVFKTDEGKPLPMFLSGDDEK